MNKWQWVTTYIQMKAYEVGYIDGYQTGDDTGEKQKYCCEVLQKYYGAGWLLGLSDCAMGWVDIET